MSKGNGRPRSTLGDLAPEFMKQWRETNADANSARPSVERNAQEQVGDREFEQTLSNWRRGGAPIKVSKGKSVGVEIRRKQALSRKLTSRTNKPSHPTNAGGQAQPRPTNGDAPPPEKSLRQRLTEASADIQNLRIIAGISRPRPMANLPPVGERADGKLAILGLDFGTAFTKAVVRWAGRHHAVDWSDAVEGEDKHLLASVYSEGPDGQCALGACDEPGWTVHEGIKLQLLTAQTQEHRGHAVVFIALAFRYVAAWFRGRTEQSMTGVRWRLHIGLPTRSWDCDSTTETFRAVAQAARVLAFRPGPLTRAAAVEAIGHANRVDRPAVDVFPEFACQLFSYLLSTERREDLHALVDIGAGTLDVAYFNVFMKDEEALLPIFASEVERLGAHYLIAALAGRDTNASWRDAECSLSDGSAALKLGCPEDTVKRRRSLYLSAVADVFNAATAKARVTYPTSPAFRRSDAVRLFLCGGGSRVPSLRDLFRRIEREAAGVFRIQFQLSELVAPKDLVGHSKSGFDRLSVAYGLSQLAADLGRVMRSPTLDPLSPQPIALQRDRDDDR